MGTATILVGKKANTAIATSYIGLVLGLLFCVVQAVAPSWVAVHGQHVLYAVVVTLGLLHGCLDFEVEANSTPSLTKLHFMLRYIAQMLLALVLWLVAPGFAFAAFVGFTAWHFGETDFSLFRTPSRWLYIFSYGLGITCWLVGMHMTPTDPYLGTWVAFTTVHVGSFSLNLVPALGALLVLLGVLLSGAWRNAQAMVWLAAMLWFGYYLSFELAFTVYFGFWHSLHTSNLIRLDVGLRWGPMLLKAMPILVLSVLLTAAMVLALGYWGYQPQVVLLVFISALTFPHTGIMHKLLMRQQVAA